MTGNPRVFIWIALALVLWLNWEAWMRDYAPATPPTPAASTQSGSSAVPPPASLGSSVPQASTSSSPASAAAFDLRVLQQIGTLERAALQIDVDVEHVRQYVNLAAGGHRLSNHARR